MRIPMTALWISALLVLGAGPASAADGTKPAPAKLQAQTLAVTPRCPADSAQDAKCVEAAGSDRNAAAQCPCIASTGATQPRIGTGKLAPVRLAPKAPALAPAISLSVPAAPTCSGASVVRCGDRCADLASDARNCGRCANQCNSGTCQAGLCVSPPAASTPG